MIVPNQSNMKVHFATTEIISQGLAAISGGSAYNLGTAFPFVYDMFQKGKTKSSNLEIISKMSSVSNHYILDSGLFTLMFGAMKGKTSAKDIELWYKYLIEFINRSNYSGTCVEVDSQKIIGQKETWRLREKMETEIKNRIINVFHLEDGEKGLDRLIEFSNYIAISVPELRILNKKNHLVKLANYIKNKKPEIDIHLLGYTEKKTMKDLNFCTSCDSSSWISGIRYGMTETIHGKGHINNIKPEIIKTHKKKWLENKAELFPQLAFPKDLDRCGILTFSANQHKKIYEKFAGPQD